MYICIYVSIGANKGIGFCICELLSEHNDLTVIVAAREENRGKQAVDKLINEGAADVECKAKQTEQIQTKNIEQTYRSVHFSTSRGRKCSHRAELEIQCWGRYLNGLE